MSSADPSTNPYTVNYQLNQLDRIGAGSGGIGTAADLTVVQTPDVPIRKHGVSDIYDYSFQFVCSVSRGHTLLEMVRRTFQSRLTNPVSRVFIGYPLEPPGNS